MTRHHAVGLLLLCMLLLVAGCEQTSIAEQEQIRNIATLQAGTPSATPTATSTPTLTPTITPSPTVGPSPTPPPPTQTPIPSPTPLPPTPTPNPALAEFSLCNQVAGDQEGGRFSARVDTITATVEPAFERLVISFSVPADSVPPHARARCISAADAATALGDPSAQSGYLLLLDLEGWLHDDLFRASTVTSTIALSGTTLLQNLSYRFDANAPAGATLGFSLEQPLPFRVELAENPTRLILEVAKTSPLGPASDMLSQPSGNASPDEPMFYLQDGDVWSYANGQASNLTNSPESETALAVSQDAGKIAFCRASAGAEFGDALATSTLWTMALDGSGLEELAAVGRTCDEPLFSPDGQTVALTVDESGATPARLSIYSVPVDGGSPERLTPQGDEWSRFGPQWLDDGRLVYAAVSEDGRSTLFVSDGEREDDIGADLLVGNTYSSLGRPLAAPDGGMIAVEALRADGSGASMLLIDASGKRQDEITGGYWTRPVAWNDDGTLFYLTSACASDAVYDYALHARAASGDDRTIAAGATLGGFGQFAAVGDGLAYVVVEQVESGARGPLAIDRASPSGLWFWDVGRGPRSRLVEAQRAITGLAQ